ncbi:MAG TPA: TadE/TadG family type IV pilus assembly protein [Bryobacteraceae bacterium]|jgi:Flp pilus assembly protein TadG
MFRARLIGSRRRGGAVLETILVLPILLYLAFGTVEFGYYFYVKHSCEGAARDGCRAAIPAGATYANITSAVGTAMSAANLGSSGYSVVVQDNGTTVASLSSAVAGDTITVTVNCTWGTAGQGYRPWNMIGSSKVVSGNAVMRKEG